MVLVGAFGLVYASVATVTSVVLYGWFLVGSGRLTTISAIRSKDRPRFVTFLLTGPLNIAGGFITLANLGASVKTLTLVLAVVLVGNGIFRVVAPGAVLVPTSGWTVFSGVVSLGLGTFALAQWPSDGAYLIGTLVSVNLVVDGVSFAIMSTSGRLTRQLLSRLRR